MTSAIGYTRLSQDSDTSIARQKRHIREYCDEHGLDLETIYDDGEFSSGFNIERSEYQNVRDAINEERVDAIVVDKKNRIGRDFDERMRFVLALREHDVQLHSWNRGLIDLSDPTDAAVESVHAAKDDESKRQEIEDAKEATRERIEAGYDHGQPPFGLQFDEDGHYWVPGENYYRALRVIAARDQGWSLREIESELDVPRSTASRIAERREKYENLVSRVVEGGSARVNPR